MKCSTFETSPEPKFSTKVKNPTEPAKLAGSARSARRALSFLILPRNFARRDKALRGAMRNVTNAYDIEGRRECLWCSWVMEDAAGKDDVHDVVAHSGSCTKCGHPLALPGTATARAIENRKKSGRRNRAA
jgi:hypothetical protein